MRARVFGFVAVVALVWGVAPAANASGPQTRSAGSTAKREVAQAKGPAKSPARKKPAKKPQKPQESRKPARKPGSAPQPADPAVRSQIAGQAVAAAPSPESPELKQISEVDRMLFWDLTEVKAEAPTGMPVVVASGLPEVTAPSPAPSATKSGAALEWMAKLNPPDLPFRWDSRLIRYLDYFKNTTSGKNFAAGLLKRSGRYEAKLREILKAKGLPEDLVYLSLCESAMNPRIVSAAGAAGLWQFMPKAGTAYGLRVDRTVDERLDPERSTEAATRFLSDLHKRFGRWELAMAAYNMGHGGLLTSIRKYNTNDFWELSELEAGVPYETALYVPKILALAFVARNKAAFGLEELVLDAPETFSDEKGRQPTTNGGKTAAKSSNVKTSAPGKLVSAEVASVSGSAPPAQAAARPEPEPTLTGTSSMTLRWGESLDTIAQPLGTTEARLRKLNGLVDPTPPRPGTVLRIPAKLGPGSPPEKLVVVVPSRTAVGPGTQRIFYEVVWGDKLAEVASILGVSEAQLVQWNNLDKTANLHAKMVLQAFVSELPDERLVRFVTADRAQLLVVGSTEFFDHFERKNGRSRFLVTAKEGDSFRGLAKRYGLSLGMLERINHRARTDELKPGDTLVIYSREKPRTSLASATLDVQSPSAAAATPDSITVEEKAGDGLEPNRADEIYDDEESIPVLSLPVVPRP